MAGITDGQNVDAADSNAAWIAKNGNDTTTGKLGLNHTGSGTALTDTQQALNNVFSTTGQTSETDVATTYGAPASTISDGDSHKAALKKLADKFHPSTGHTHSGAAGDGGPLASSSLSGVPLKGSFAQGTDLIGVTGSSTNVTTQMSGKTASAGSTSQGVVVTAPNNKIVIRQASGASEDDTYLDGSGNIVYGRLTFSSGTWTLSYFVNLSGTETVYSFAGASDVRWYYQELFNPITNAPVYSELATIPSDNATADVINATQSLFGTTKLGNAASSDIAAAGTTGTANARVSNADHTHAGVHSVSKSGSAQILGDATFSATGATSLTQVSSNIEVTSPAFSSSTPADVGATGNAGSASTMSKSDHVHKGLHSIAKNGDSAIFGDATLSAGTNVTLTESGQDIKIDVTQPALSQYNYIANPDAETDTSGWAAYNDGATATPVDGTGGTPTISLTRTTSSPLRGSGSFLISKTAANEQGQGVSYDLSIGNGDKTAVLQVSFKYEVSSNFTAGDSSDLRVWIFDVTNGVLIQPAPFTIQGGNGSPHRFKASFQAPSNSTSFRLIFHIATTSANNWTFKFDDVVLGPDVQAFSSFADDPTAYTPTFTGFGTVSGVEFESWRVGSFLKVKGKFTSGTSTATEARVTLGYKGFNSNVTSGDTTLIPSIKLCGSGALDAALASDPTILIEPSVGYVTFGLQDSTNGGLTKQNGNALISSGQKFSFVCEIPIQGWATQNQLSTDADTRVVAAKYTSSTTSATGGATTTLVYPTKSYDTHAAYNSSTGVFTCPVSGKYRISAGYRSGSTQAAAAANSVNRLSGRNTTQSVSSDMNSFNHQVTTALTPSGFGETVIDAIAGDTLDVVLTVSGNVGTFSLDGNATLNWVSFERISGPASISVSENINGLVQSGGVSVSSSETTITYDALSDPATFDTHGAINTSTGDITILSSGKYRFHGYIKSPVTSWTAGDVVELHIFKNGSLWQIIDRWTAETSHSSIRIIKGELFIKPVVGDVFSLRATSTVTKTYTAILFYERLGI